MLGRARNHDLRRADNAIADRVTGSLHRDDRAIRDLIGRLHGDRFVALGIEPVSGRADPLNALTGEDHVHLLQQRSHPLRAGRRLQLHRPLDAIDDVEPFLQHRLPRLGHPAFDFPFRALAIVVEVGQRAFVAVLDPGQLGGQLLAVAGGTGGRGLRLGLRRRARTWLTLG